MNVELSILDLADLVGCVHVEGALWERAGYGRTAARLEDLRERLTAAMLLAVRELPEEARAGFQAAMDQALAELADRNRRGDIP